MHLHRRKNDAKSQRHCLCECPPADQSIFGLQLRVSKTRLPGADSFPCNTASPESETRWNAFQGLSGGAESRFWDLWAMCQPMGAKTETKKFSESRRHVGNRLVDGVRSLWWLDCFWPLLITDAMHFLMIIGTLFWSSTWFLALEISKQCSLWLNLARMRNSSNVEKSRSASCRTDWVARIKSRDT